MRLYGRGRTVTLELQLGDFHRPGRLAGQKGDLDLGRLAIRLDSCEVEQRVFDIIEGIGSRFAGLDSPNDDLPLVVPGDAVRSDEDFTLCPSSEISGAKGWYVSATGFDNVIHQLPRDPPVVFRIAMLDRPLRLPCLIEACADFSFARHAPSGVRRSRRRQQLPCTFRHTLSLLRQYRHSVPSLAPMLGTRQHVPIVAQR
jgi:hypothetical protein